MKILKTGSSNPKFTGSDTKKYNRFHRRRFFVDLTNSEGAKLFCEVWLNLIILFQSEISECYSQIQLKIPPKKKQKKGLRRILVLSQSRISKFLFTPCFA